MPSFGPTQNYLRVYVDGYFMNEVYISFVFVEHGNEHTNWF